MVFDNEMIVNLDKCNYMCFRKNNAIMILKAITKSTIKNNNEETIPWRKIDLNLVFNNHISNFI